MATNLRLAPEIETALREEAARTGRSQQEIIRTALERHLRLVPEPPVEKLDPLVLSGRVRAPRTPFRRALALLELPEGVTSLDLMDRDDRF